MNFDESVFYPFTDDSHTVVIVSPSLDERSAQGFASTTGGALDTGLQMPDKLCEWDMG